MDLGRGVGREEARGAAPAHGSVAQVAVGRAQIEPLRGHVHRPEQPHLSHRFRKNVVIGLEREIDRERDLKIDK